MVNKSWNGKGSTINRFPKMMLLWYVVSKKVFQLDEYLSMARGYYTATVFAIMKQISQRKKGIEQSIGRKMSKDENEKFCKDLFEPPIEEMKSYEFIETLENPLHKYMWYRKGRNDMGGGMEVYVYIDGKSVPTIIKFMDQIKKKFQSREQTEKYIKFVEKIIDENPSLQDRKFWTKNWFDFWEKYRDENWDEIIDKEKDLKFNKISQGLFDRV